jgi:putative FmdB family regulatory protein
MPTYEYRCKDCGEHLEVVQSFKDDPLTECPACGGSLRKVFGNIGITFKGSGFYKTDSRSGSTKPAEKKEPAAAATAGDSSSSSDSKAAPAKSTEKKAGEKKSGDSKSSAAKSA